MSGKIRGIWQKYKELILYTICGCIATVVNVGLFLLLHFCFGINELVANALSWIITVGVAYVTNRVWVFQSKVRGRGLWKEILTFYTGRLVTLSLDEGILFVFVTLLSCNAAVVKIAAQVVVMVGNYIVSKIIVFRKK